jgi:hypothetical protein
VQALPKAQVSAAAVDVIAVRIRELMFVAVGGGVEQQHERPLWNHATVQLGVLRDVACLDR